MKNERRVTDRIQKPGFAWLQGRCRKLSSASVLDVSPTGTRVSSELRVGDSYAVSLDLGSNELVRAQGRVVWARSGQSGIQFQH